MKQRHNKPFAVARLQHYSAIHFQPIPVQTKIGAKRVFVWGICRECTHPHVIRETLEPAVLFRSEASSVGPKPKRSAEGTVTSEVWKGRQVTAGNVGSLRHPRWIVGNTLARLKPAAYEVASLYLPRSVHRGLLISKSNSILLWSLNLLNALA